ncbi:MAG: family 43 glycosylhydrolase, partial [Oscillospiraceae bacterium]|nr:family 43 glycosylhydrolase [Oscillospiraceae bacterium]
PSAHIWKDYDGGERLWLYPSTDVFPAEGCNLMDQYHVYSTDNMLDWIDHGEILRRDDLPTTPPFGPHHENAKFMWAPDAAYNSDLTATGGKGPFFYYFPHAIGGDERDGFVNGSPDHWGDSWKVFVAWSDSPYQGFKDNDIVCLKDKNGVDIVKQPGVDLIDPCVYYDDTTDDYYIILGGGGQCRIARLKKNMVQLDEDWTILNHNDGGQWAEWNNLLPHYHEGPWMFDRLNASGQKIYYMMYPGNAGGSGGDNMLYSTADNPYGPWDYKGSILDKVNTGDTSHGSIQEFKGHWYIFYHNAQLSGGHGALRSVCVEEVFFNPDGTIRPIPQTATSVPAIAPPVNKTDLDNEFGPGNYEIEVKYKDIEAGNYDDYQMGFQYPTWNNDKCYVRDGANKQSNTQAVHNMGQCIFVDVDGGPVGGRALLEINYSKPDNGSGFVIVNDPKAYPDAEVRINNVPTLTGIAATTYPAPYPISYFIKVPGQGPGVWEDFSAYTYTFIDLLPGEVNRIMIGGTAMNVKGITIYFESGQMDDYTRPVNDCVIRAGNTNFTYGNSVNPGVGKPKLGGGSDFIENMEENGAWCQFGGLDGEEGGIFVLEIEYFSGNSNAVSFDVVVNGKSYRVTLPPTGGWDKSKSDTFRMFVMLEEGTDNKVVIKNGSGGSNFVSASIWARPKAAGALVDPPTLVSKTSTSITVQSAAPGNGQTAEYAYSTTSTAPTTGWQDSGVFSGLSEYTPYYFFARSKENAGYETGAASAGTLLRTADVTPPTGAIWIKTNSFESFLNTISFGLFFKQPVTISIASADGGSGVDTIEYCESTTAYETAGEMSAVSWTPYTAPFSRAADWKGYIYAKITDNEGNVTVIRSDGVVVYTDSAAVTTNISHTKLSGSKTADVTLNGNTIDKIMNGGTTLVYGTDYTVSGGTITFAGAYLDSLAASATAYTLTVYYNPLGETYVTAAGNDAPGTTTISVTVSKADPTVTWPSGLTAAYGDTLADIVLTGYTNTPAGTFTWTAAGTTSVGAAGPQTHNMTFTPTDTTNYNTVTQDVTVTVGKINPSVTWPSGLTAAYGDTLADIVLTGYTNT